jgi:hypothetical protein
VPKQIGAVGWWIRDSGASQGSANDSRDDHARTERPEWCFRAEKDTIDGSPWARMFYVVQNGVSRILRQR